MATQMKAVRELLFGAQGLGASNFKMFPGFSREATPEMIANDITNALNEVLNGDAEEFVCEEAAEA